MSKKPYILDFKEEDEPLALKDVLAKYIRFWPWFLVSCIFFITLGYFYTKYAPKTFHTEAKIKILDNTSDPKIIPKDAADNNQNLKLNLENHIEVLQSFHLLDRVVGDLNLDIEFYEFNKFSYSQIWSPPFYVEKIIEDDKIVKPLEYRIVLETAGFKVTDMDGNIFIIPYNERSTESPNLPFSISLGDIEYIKEFKDVKYKLVLKQKRQVTSLLAEELNISTSEKQSDVLTLSLNDNSTSRSEAILDEIVKNFDQESVLDKQMVAEQTLKLIDQRLQDLSKELDSIEREKENYKKLGDIAYIKADANVNLQKRTLSESEVLKLETQQSLLNILRRAVNNEDENNLLPADIGLANSALNNMVEKYNEMARERQKLLLSVGPNHPSLGNLLERMKFDKQNILRTVKVYGSQIAISLRQFNEEKSRAGTSYAQQPEKERILRSIERQQNIKENLYLLLLRKREEAAIDYAATSSSIKVIDYSLSSLKPTWPKKTIIFPLALLLGLVLPFMVIYLRSSFDNKIYDRAEVERINPEIPTLIEIPFFKEEKTFNNFNEGSALAESFRILCTNTDHIIPINPAKGKIIYVTSAIKEEGKTLAAVNLSMAYASMGKRVLLVGADLRNPQLHKYMDLDKDAPGLSDYLKTSRFDFNEGIQKGIKDNSKHSVYLSGMIPSNAPVLLSSKRFGEFIERAKLEYDYVIVDTAPTMLVTDTLLISKYADETLFVLRSGFTDKNVMQFSKELNKKGKLNNMAYVLNAVGKANDAKYNYGYAYGYSNS